MTSYSYGPTGALAHHWRAGDHSKVVLHYGPLWLWRCAWPCVVVALRKYGPVQLLSCAIMVLCKYGPVQLWPCAIMALCNYGHMLSWPYYGPVYRYSPV